MMHIMLIHHAHISRYIKHIKLWHYAQNNLCAWCYFM